MDALGSFEFGQQTLNECVRRVNKLFNQIVVQVKKNDFSGLNGFKIHGFKSEFKFLMQKIIHTLEQFQKVQNASDLKDFFAVLKKYYTIRKLLGKYENCLSNLCVTESVIRDMLIRLKLKCNMLSFSIHNYNVNTYMASGDVFLFSQFSQSGSDDMDDELNGTNVDPKMNEHNITKTHKCNGYNAFSLLSESGFWIDVNCVTKTISIAHGEKIMSKYPIESDLLFNERKVDVVEDNLFKYIKDMMLSTKFEKSLTMEMDNLTFDVGIKEKEEMLQSEDEMKRYYLDNDGDKLLYSYELKKPVIVSLYFVTDYLLKNKKLYIKDGKEYVNRKYLKSYKKSLILQENEKDRYNTVKIIKGGKGSIFSEFDEEYIFSTNSKDSMNPIFALIIRVLKSNSIEGLGKQRVMVERQVIYNNLFVSCFKKLKKYQDLNKMSNKMRIEIEIAVPFMIYLVIFHVKKSKILNLKINVKSDLRIVIKEKDNSLNKKMIEACQKILEKENNIPLLIHFLCKKWY